MKTSTAACGLALAFALAGCTSGQQQQAQDQAQQAASAAPAAAKDSLLAAAVATRLAGVDVDSTTTVHVAANAGTVTLSGQAHTAQERENYEQTARSTDGVTAVRDLVTVNPQLQGIRRQTSDAALAARVSAAIAGQAGLNVFHVAASAHDGTITLTGRVPSQSIQKTIDETARGVDGVRGVNDRLTVGS